MRNAKVLSIVSLALILNGCAFQSSHMPMAEKICSDSPRNSVMTFLRGISEFSVFLLKQAILSGMEILAVFGGGSVERGREVVRSIVDHPEVRRGNEVDNVYSLIAMSGEGDEYDVTIERKANILFVNENMRVETEIYRRSFHVVFNSIGNCIVSVHPIETEWVRVDTPASER